MAVMADPQGIFGLRIPFLELLCLRGESAGGGVARLSVELRPELMNSLHVAHGGVVMTLLDVAMAMAARTIHGNSRGHPGTAVTIDMSVSFMLPATGRIVAEGRVLHGGKSMVFCESEAKDESGKLVAKAMGTFKLLREMHEGEGN